MIPAGSTLDTDDPETDDRFLSQTLQGCSVRDTMNAKKPPLTPRERFEQVSNLQVRPRELRSLLLDLLVVLGNERAEIRKRQEDISAKIGRAAYAAAECGTPYEQLAPKTGIERNAIYRAAGNAVGPITSIVLRDQKPGEVARLVRKLKDLAPQRLAANADLVANSEGLAPLVQFLHHELNVSVQELSENGQLYRSTVHGWVKSASEGESGTKSGKTKTYIRPRTADTPYTGQGRKWTGKKK